MHLGSRNSNMRFPITLDNLVYEFWSIFGPKPGIFGAPQNRPKSTKMAVSLVGWCLQVPITMWGWLVCMLAHSLPNFDLLRSFLGLSGHNSIMTQRYMLKLRKWAKIANNGQKMPPLFRHFGSGAEELGSRRGLAFWEV